MAAVITTFIDQFRDSEIPGIEKVIEQLHDICWSGIVNSDAVSMVEIFFKNKLGMVTGYYAVHIDWGRHAFHVGAGDVLVSLTRHLTWLTLPNGATEQSFSASSISDALDVIHTTLRDSVPYQNWVECIPWVNWSKNIDYNGSDRLKVLQRMGYAKLPTNEEQQDYNRTYAKYKREAEASVYFEETPACVDELLVTGGVIAYFSNKVTHPPNGLPWATHRARNIVRWLRSNLSV